MASRKSRKKQPKLQKAISTYPHPLRSDVPELLADDFENEDHHAWQCFIHFWPDFGSGNSDFRGPYGKREETKLVIEAGTLLLACRYLLDTVKQRLKGIEWSDKDIE